MLLCKKVLFELPVYRLSKEKYYAEFSAYKEKHKSSNINDSYLLGVFGGAWEYNEIVGFLKFYLSGNTQIRCVYTETDAKRKVKTRKKIFIETSHSYCTREINRKKSNDAILKILEECISHCEERLPVGRFIDRSIFDSVFKYTDWQAVMA